MIDVAGIVRETVNYPVDWLVVEQHDFEMPKMESIAISLKNVRAMRP